MLRLISDEIFRKFEKKFPTDKELYAKGDAEQTALFKRSYEEQFCQTSGCMEGINSTNYKNFEVG